MVQPLTLEMLQKRVKGNRMDLSCLRLEHVPLQLIVRCMTKGAEITEMDFSNNVLTSLPEQFCLFFPELEVLILRQNKIKKLPENFGSLTALRQLDLSHNSIKKLPNSFADLGELEWLNLSRNPLLRDLAEVIGNCSNDAQCAAAARNAVQYVNFSVELPSESTAIADESGLMPTNGSSSSEVSNKEKILPKSKRDVKGKYRRPAQSSSSHNRQQQQRTMTNNPVPIWRQTDTQSSSNSGYFTSNCIFVIILISIFALGVTLWLTLDSIREACGSEELSLSGNETGREFCADITKLFTNGKAPDSWGQFVRNFVETFKIHWIQAVNKPLINKFSFLFDSKQLDSLAKQLFAYMRFTLFLLWQICEPVVMFFKDYFTYIWWDVVLPLIFGED